MRMSEDAVAIGRTAEWRFEVVRRDILRGGFTGRVYLGWMRSDDADGVRCFCLLR